MNNFGTRFSEVTKIFFMIIQNVNLFFCAARKKLTFATRGRHKKNFAPHPGEVVRSQWRSLENLVGHKENVLLTTTSRRAQLRSRSKSMKL